MKKILQSIIGVIKKHQILFIANLLVYIFGIILGMFLNKNSFIDFSNEFTLNFLNNAIFPSSSPIKFLFKRVLNCILLFVILVIISLNKYTNFLNLLFVLYKGFILIVSFKYLTYSLSISGFFIFIFLVLIQNVLTAFSIVLFVILSYNTHKNHCNHKVKYILLSSIISLTVCLASFIIEFILLIAIIRPYNLYF